MATVFSISVCSDLGSGPCNGEKIERVALGLLEESNSVRGRGVSSCTLLWSSVKGADQQRTASLNKCYMA